MPEEFIERWETFAFQHGRLKRPQMLRIGLNILEEMAGRDFEELRETTKVPSLHPELHPFHTKMPEDFIERWETFAFNHGRLKRPPMLRLVLAVCEALSAEQFQARLASLPAK